MLPNFQDFLNENDNNDLIPPEKFEEIKAMEPHEAIATFIELLKENSKNLSADEVQELLYGKENSESWRDVLTESQKYNLKTKEELTEEELEFRLTLKGFTGAYSLFTKTGIRTISDISQFCSLETMTRSKRIGPKTMKKLHEVLTSKGLKFLESTPIELDDSLFALYVSAENKFSWEDIRWNYALLPLRFLVDSGFKSIKELGKISENEFYTLLDNYPINLTNGTIGSLVDSSKFTKKELIRAENLFEFIAQSIGYKPKQVKVTTYMDNNVLKQLKSKEINRLRAEIAHNVLEWMNRFKVKFLPEEA